VLAAAVPPAFRGTGKATPVPNKGSTLMPPSAPVPFPHPLLLGHRGAPRVLPENTLASFRRALADGADGVELDVQRAADGVPVVIHDATLERTTNGRGPVASHTSTELARLDAGAGEGVPTLAAVAAWAAEAGAWLNVELKADGVEAAALEVLGRAGVLESTFLSSFSPTAVAEVGRLAPAVRRFLLTERWNARVRAAVTECGAHGVCLETHAATEAALAELAALGLPLVVWTEDHPARIRALFAAGVAGVITNDPAAR
jgi:glycerophosphoryl diester phosphodiesterase